MPYICLYIYILVGCKHWASVDVFYIGGRCCVLCQFFEPVMFGRCTFIYALLNIVLGGYLDTRRNIYNIYGKTSSLKQIQCSVLCVKKSHN